MPPHGGLDWGGAAHAICVVDATGRIVARIEARHDAASLADMLARLKRGSPPAELRVAIERMSGLIVNAGSVKNLGCYAASWIAGCN